MRSSMRSLLVFCAASFVAGLACADVEPNAGQWRTWVIASGKDYRAPPPPSPSQTQTELRSLVALLAQPDPAVQKTIAYWDAGPPGYRWTEMIERRIVAGTPTTAYSHRVLTYVALAIHDATIATWDSKYAYNRPRPSLRDNRVQPTLPVPDSPSYPAEHSAAAQAAAVVLAHFLPAESATFLDMAHEAGWSRVQAGLQYPSDHFAGMALGQRVAEAVIAKADADGADAVWQGTVPTGPCTWIGANPVNVTAAGWKPLLLDSPDQFRPPPPPPCDSQQAKDETATVRNFPRSIPGNGATFNTNSKAFYWQTNEGRFTWTWRYLDQWVAEDRLDRNPPRAARAYALLAASFFDAFIASQDGKYAYWYPRPPQLDPGIVPLFPVPPFPSYPSNHSTFSATSTEVLAYLFPARADFIRALGKEAGDSRIWAGIHYPMDNVAGVALGKAVAAVFIARDQQNGP